jgi:hypothetical protein
VTSIGGGRGFTGDEFGGGATGGSGGGGFAPPSAYPAGSGTTNQGFRGGNVTYNHVPNGYGCAGGGGAGAQGSDSVPSAGGSGVASSITGSAVTRAGGGGGGGMDNLQALLAAAQVDLEAAEMVPMDLQLVMPHQEVEIQILEAAAVEDQEEALLQEAQVLMVVLVL